MKEIKLFNLIPVIKSAALSPEDWQARVQLHETLQAQTNGLVHLDSDYVEHGSSALETAYDLSVTLPYVLAKATWAERNGYDAVVLDCFMDPGLDACRELLNIPVLGACQSACSLAMRLGGRFSVLETTDSCERGIDELLRKYGYADWHKPVPALDIAVLDLYEKRQQVIERIVELGVTSIRQNKVKALVFGCTSMSEYVAPVMAALAERGYPALVIDPLRATVYDALSCVLHGVSQSRLAYQLMLGKEMDENFGIL